MESSCHPASSHTPIPLSRARKDPPATRDVTVQMMRGATSPGLDRTNWHGRDDEGPDHRTGPLIVDGLQSDVTTIGGGGGNRTRVR